MRILSEIQKRKKILLQNVLMKLHENNGEHFVKFYENFGEGPKAFEEIFKTLGKAFEKYLWIFSIKVMNFK